MDRSTALDGGAARLDRLARRAERVLRLAGDSRPALALLLAAGAANALAAALPDGGRLLDSPAYLVLLGAVLLSGMAAVAVRLPATWREWRVPGPPPDGGDSLSAEVTLEGGFDPATREALRRELAAAGYRVVERTQRGRWTLAGVRRGWSRFAGLGSHLALVLLVLGAAIGAAFSSETSFSLLPGEQALLDAPRAGFTDAVRLDAFDAEFGPDGRPLRLDTAVTFLRDGRAVRSQTIEVNRPGQFGGYLVHGWTYGPAASLRVTTLGGQPVLAAPLALQETLTGRPYAQARVPTLGLVVSALLVDAGGNRLRVGVSDSDQPLDSAEIGPGESVRLGGVEIRHQGMTSYVTFLSRRDPGMGLLFGGGALLTVSLAVAFWLPRRRLSVSQQDGGLRLVLRGERFDRPAGELAGLRERISAVVSRSP